MRWVQTEFQDFSEHLGEAAAFPSPLKKVTDSYGLTEVEGSIHLQQGNVIVHRPSGVKVGMLDDIFNRERLLAVFPDPQIVLSCSDVQILQYIPGERKNKSSAP